VAALTPATSLQGSQLGADKQDGEVVALAGLCHDLGHGPFSHVFDNEFLPRRHGSAYDPDAWTHEGMGADMLEYLVDQNCIETAHRGGSDLVKRVRSLITSGHSGEAGGGKGFLREIVANGRNSVDVDKFDYIQRDCRNCGLKSSTDFERLMQYIKVIDDEICFKASEVLNVYELFHTRASLHQRVYTHRKAKAIEYMVVDALVSADAAWGNEISKAIWKPEEFVKLDDTVLKRIEWSSDPALREAQDILRRLRRRELYRYVNEFTVPSERLSRWKDVRPEEIVACQDAGNSAVPGGLRPEDIIVHNLKIDWAMKAKNPVDSVHFYQDYGSDTKFSIPKEKVSLLIPDIFLERKVRVYSKRDDPAYVAAAETAFLAFQQREFKVRARRVRLACRRRSCTHLFAAVRPNGAPHAREAEPQTAARACTAACRRCGRHARRSGSRGDRRHAPWERRAGRLRRNGRPTRINRQIGTERI
jgi:HD superfamily phosphohydrolase